MQEDIYKKYKEKLFKQNFPSLDNYQDYKPVDYYLNEKLDSKEKKLLTDTAYLQVFMIGTVLFLYTLPPSITNWEDEGDKSLSEKWSDHVQAGPVWDKDDWTINYIGHPVSGAWYYMVARDDGFSPMESFAYSFILSTFFWEYGYEAFAEIPSTQDLIFTPTLGSLMGEGFYYLEKKLDQNGGVIWGSKTLGNISYFLLNPIGNIVNSMNSFFDITLQVRYQALQNQAYFHVSPYLKKVDYVPQTYGFIIDIKF